jgi:acyl-CoA synthetase (AMP-forming)/AMP-acid ligase II
MLCGVTVCGCARGRRAGASQFHVERGRTRASFWSIRKRACCSSTQIPSASAWQPRQRISNLCTVWQGELDPVPEGIPSWEALFGSPDAAEELTDSDDLLQIIYTSGTESRPKGAMLTHGAVLWQYQSCVIDGEWTADAIVLHAMPLFHCAQLDAMMGPGLQIGACNIITAQPHSEQHHSPAYQLPRHRVFRSGHGMIALLRSPLFESI